MTTQRVAGILGIMAGVIGMTVALINQFAVPAVSAAVTSFPLAAAPFVALEVLLTLMHAAIFMLVLGLWRSGVAGRGRLASIGFIVALVGLAIQIVAEFGYVFAASTEVDALLPSALSTAFGVSSILVAVGMVLVGIRTIVTKIWVGWRMFAPLLVGIMSVILIPLVFSWDTRNWALTAWSLTIAILGAALATATAAGRVNMRGR